VAEQSESRASLLSRADYLVLVARWTRTSFVGVEYLYDEP